jgi:hypothetical protein
MVYSRLDRADGPTICSSSSDNRGDGAGAPHDPQHQPDSGSSSDHFPRTSPPVHTRTSASSLTVPACRSGARPAWWPMLPAQGDLDNLTRALSARRGSRTGMTATACCGLVMISSNGCPRARRSVTSGRPGLKVGGIRYTTSRQFLRQAGASSRPRRVELSGYISFGSIHNLGKADAYTAAWKALRLDRSYEGPWLRMPAGHLASGLHRAVQQPILPSGGQFVLWSASQGHGLQLGRRVCRSSSQHSFI